MPFRKNDININRKGRARGVQNNDTTDAKNLLMNLFKNNLNEIVHQQDKLSLNQRILLNRMILPYILPTIKKEDEYQFIEQPLFTDVDTSDCEKKEFDVKQFFRIDSL